MIDKKDELKKFFLWLRNGFAFSTTWLLIICLAYCHIFKEQTISTDLLRKLLIFAFGGVLIFNLIFTRLLIKKWTFNLRLTAFMLVFGLYESLAFSWLGFFSGRASLVQWLIFIGLVAVLYFISLAIYQVYSKKQGEIYTENLRKYQKQRSWAHDR
ncbi:MAG: hypothetical protein Q4E36_01835 [Bacillota bacterium]|nr:hypothetical protein [Bacillota bacterium]